MSKFRKSKKLDASQVLWKVSRNRKFTWRHKQDCHWRMPWRYNDYVYGIIAASVAELWGLVYGARKIKGFRGTEWRRPTNFYELHWAFGRFFDITLSHLPANFLSGQHNNMWRTWQHGSDTRGIGVKCSALGTPHLARAWRKVSGEHAVNATMTHLLLESFLIKRDLLWIDCVR